MKFVGIWFLIIPCSSCFFNQTVDLGYSFNESTSYWFDIPELNLSDTTSHIETSSMMSDKFEALYYGTHLDAPYHYNPDGWKVADIPLDRLIVQGAMVDKRVAAAQNPDTEVSVKDLVEWEQRHGPLPDSVLVIFDFGWANKYSNKTEYFGIKNGNATGTHFPGLSEGAADWLVQSGKVVGVGVDTPSVDRGVNRELIAHQLLTAANIYLVENLALEDTDLPARGFQLIVMPMKIVNGTEAPLRIVAWPTMSSATSFFSRVMAWFVSIWIIITSLFK